MKKHNQLGMNAGTASHRLVKDLLFRFISESGYKCYRCQGVLTREDFSIDHVTPWLDSKTPKELFFDLSNISYSHKLCNSRAARKPGKFAGSAEEKAKHHAATEKARWNRLSKEKQQEIRKAKYARNGC